MTDIDVSLIRKCKRRDRQALSILLSRYEAYLYRLCYSYLCNEQDALDVVQEVFIKVCKHISQFDETKSFLPWLKRITINTCLNFRRDTKAAQHLSLDFAKEDNWSFVENVKANEDVEKTVIGLTLKEDIRKCLDLLPPRPRMVLTLRYMEDLSCQEIAVLLARPLGTIKNSLFRARNLLKTVLLEQGFLEV